MKFEKFLKGCGTHGETFTRENGDNWLICEGVAMRVPKGVKNLLGIANKDTEPVFSALFGTDTTDDVLKLKEALLRDAEGKAGDIIRVFETDLGDRVGIYNGEFGLIEKKDLLTYLEIEVPGEKEEDEPTTIKFIVVLDPKTKETIGFITGLTTI